MPKLSYYQQDIISIMAKYKVDNLEAMRIYREQHQDDELKPKTVDKIIDDYSETWKALAWGWSSQLNTALNG